MILDIYPGVTFQDCRIILLLLFRGTVILFHSCTIFIFQPIMDNVFQFLCILSNIMLLRIAIPMSQMVSSLCLWHHFLNGCSVCSVKKSIWFLCWHFGDGVFISERPWSTTFPSPALACCLLCTWVFFTHYHPFLQCSLSQFPIMFFSILSTFTWNVKKMYLIDEIIFFSIKLFRARIQFSGSESTLQYHMLAFIYILHLMNHVVHRDCESVYVLIFSFQLCLLKETPWILHLHSCELQFTWGSSSVDCRNWTESSVLNMLRSNKKMEKWMVSVELQRLSEGGKG